METFLSAPIRKKKTLLILGDAVCVFFAIYLAYSFRIVVYEGASATEIWDRITWLMPLAVMMHLITFYVFELYNIEKRSSFGIYFLWILVAVLVATGMIVVTSYGFPKHKMGRVLVSAHLIFVILAVSLWRFFFFNLLIKKAPLRNLLFIDCNEQSCRFVEKPEETVGTNYNCVGTAALSSDGQEGFVLNKRTNYSNLKFLIEQKKVGALVLLGNMGDIPQISPQLIDLKFQGVEIYDYPTFYQKINGKTPVLATKDSWVLYSTQNKSFQPAYYLRIKRALDFLFAFLGFLVSIPLLLLVAVVIKLNSKGPVIFSQERLGINEKLFRLHKFRTMIDKAEKNTGPMWSSRSDPRITPVGRILRKTRLDELPQLFNVLKGDISIVGPRPIRKHFADLLGEQFPFYRLRFSVKPGLTGWAQVQGDYAGSVEGQLQKLEYELFYIQNRSTFLDLFIILKTFQTLLFRPGE